MNHFEYRDGVLCAEGVSVADMADAIGTPFYCYSSATLTRHARVFLDAFKGQPARLCYSVKANSNLAVIATLAAQGAGADVVSEGELRRALAAGIAPAQIVFSGVGKTAAEMTYALEVGIDQFNVESEPELELLATLAAAQNKIAKIAIRVNPDVDAKTHEKIATGKAENKFGISWKLAPAVYARAAQLPSIAAIGIDVHIGSQLTSLEPFKAAFTRVAGMVEALRAEGHTISHIDLGGGLGIPYRGDNDIPPHPDEYAALVKATMGHLGCDLTFEPGRLVVGNAGILVARVIYVKEGDDRTFLIIDAAMNDLIRPTLYEAFHEIKTVAEPKDEARITYDVVGPVCETGDFMAKGRDLPPVKAGDLIAIMSAGAYGAVQASTYNTRLLVPEILVHGDEFAVIRARPDYAEILKQDKIPAWLQPDPSRTR
ncbi:MAG: diaminopimelate decarboxylase [Parvibaculum sp.]|nr:diaminopimelate decarboxylase [Parvibaculum sp.]|tara:strand:+ start:3046 stop:4332 length:1287 start_codon:yes stop_codon:yes gene_type:complete